MKQYLLLIIGASIIFSTSAYAQETQDIEILISSPNYNYGDKLDYTKIISEKKSDDLIIIKANPLFEIEHKK